MEKPVNKSEKRGERKGMVRGFAIAIILYLLTALWSQVHAQTFDVQYVSGEDQRFQYEDGSNAIDIVVNIYNEGCSPHINVQYSGKESNYIIHRARVYEGGVIWMSGDISIVYNAEDEMITISNADLFSGLENAVYRVVGSSGIAIL